MTNAQQVTPLSTTPLAIGYRRKGRDVLITQTPELKIHYGSFICLLGPNGAGKSTLIRTLAGIQKPLRGTIQLDNQPLGQLSPRQRARRISIVLTEMQPPSILNAYSLVALGRHPHSGKFGILRPRDRERIAWAFQAAGAEGLENCQVAQLSDGERQKLLIARALAQETPLMLLDEPTAFLDLPRQIELMSTLRKMAHLEQMGILLSTHNLDLALRFADRIWLFDTDNTIIKGYPEELALSGTISRTFSSNEVIWNSEHGTFRIQANPNLKAKIQGDSMLALWTQRALERLGFTIVEKVEPTALQVRVEETEQTSTLSVDYNSKTARFDSISHFIDWITQQTFPSGSALEITKRH